ncbi:MAG: IGHMBP2 family helicase [Planctomycetaceae bacterium]|nr:IGHMBP2 family helicase [Planctomycetaceae bacterium]
MNHFDRLLQLLALESAAEEARIVERSKRMSPAQAEQAGDALVDMVADDEDLGLGGRTIVTFVKRNRTLGLPWTRLGTGSPVVITATDPAEAGHVRGVVCERRESTIRVALPERDELPEADVFRLDASRDEVTNERQRSALKRARDGSGERLPKLRRVLLGEHAPEFGAERPLVAEPLDHLNESQQAAIRWAMSAHDVALIHGPPGTGKTTTVVELIRQAVRRGDKVLACAPSNLAVDNLLERLVAKREKAVRLGHPARVMAELREHTLDLLVDNHNDVKLARKLVREARQMFRKAGRYTRARPEPGARREMREEAKQLLADARRMENLAVKDILDRADVLCVTTTGIDDELLADRQFDLVVIDEACQSIEPGCWIPLLRARRIVLAGDHCQLPPTIVSGEAAAGGLSVSLFERLVAQFGNLIARRLDIQYRMHEAIAGFSSAEFYDNALVAHPSVAAHRLVDIPHIAPSTFAESPLEFIDTAGAGYDEELEPDGESRRNSGEADVVAKMVEALTSTGLAANDIAVITPYAAQARLLRERIAVPGVEIDSVDGFQGREKEAVIISLVRSNATGEIGFLADVRRMNVALTRARRKLIVIGDSATLANHPFYGRFLEYVEQHGLYRTVWELDV